MIIETEKVIGLEKETSDLTPADLELLEKYLSRLDSTNHGIDRDSDPQQRLSWALEAKNKPISQVATEFGVHWGSVHKAVRDVNSILIYLSGEEADNEKTAVQLGKLSQLDAEQAKMKFVLHSLKVCGFLAKIPQAYAVLHTYVDYRSLHVLGADDCLEYKKEHDKELRHFLLMDEIKNRGLPTLISRYTLFNWLENGPEDVVSHAAVYLLENDNKSMPEKYWGRLNQMRMFLSDMAEMEAAKYDSGSWYRPTVDGQLDVIELYRRYAATGFCPASISDFANSVLTQHHRQSRIAAFRPGQFYDDDTRISLDWSGRKFLENVLFWQARLGKQEMDMSVFTFNAREYLRKAQKNYLSHPRKPRKKKTRK